MPYRFWYAILTAEEGKKYRIGPYSTRRAAERKASQIFRGAATADISVVYEVGPSPHHGR